MVATDINRTLFVAEAGIQAWSHVRHRPYATDAVIGSELLWAAPQFFCEMCAGRGASLPLGME